MRCIVRRIYVSPLQRLLLLACFVLTCAWLIGVIAQRPLTTYVMAERSSAPHITGFYAPEQASDGTAYRWTSGLAVIRAVGLVPAPEAIWYVTVAASTQITPMQLNALPVAHQDERRYAILARPTRWNGVQALRIGTTTFTDPAEARELGVRVISASLSHVWQPYPAVLWVCSVALLALMAALSAWLLGWGWRGVLIACVLMLLMATVMQWSNPRAAGLWVRNLAGVSIIVPLAVWLLRRWFPVVLLTGWASVLLLRLWGIRAPSFEGHDYAIHLRRLSDFRTGIWTMSAHPYEFGRRQSVILPLFYRVSDALAEVLGTHLAMHLMIVCAETSIALLVWLMLRRVSFPPRAALLSAFLVLLMPLSSSVLYWAFMQQISAHVLTFAIAYLTTRGTTKSAWLAAVLLAVVALTHIGETFIAAVWYSALRLAEPDRFRPQWWWRSLPVVVAGVAVLPLYLTFLGNVGASGSALIQPISPAILAQLGVAFTVGLAPVPIGAAIIALAVLVWQRPRVAIPWLAVVAVFATVEALTRAQVRYLYTGAPLIAVAVGWCIQRVWRYGWAGRLLVLLVVAYVAWVSSALWIDAVMGWQKPRIDGLTH